MNQLVFAENGSSVDTVMVDGRVLVEGGRITAFDADAILAEARPMMEANLERNAELLGLARHMADLFS
jgi:cytosine/adenosine deaminase-related metal-dependent hydrolase